MSILYVDKLPFSLHVSGICPQTQSPACTVLHELRRFLGTDREILAVEIAHQMIMTGSELIVQVNTGPGGAVNDPTVLTSAPRWHLGATPGASVREMQVSDTLPREASAREIASVILSVQFGFGDGKAVQG
jgi:hypothetical protein